MARHSVARTSDSTRIPLVRLRHFALKDSPGGPAGRSSETVGEEDEAGRGVTYPAVRSKTFGGVAAYDFIARFITSLRPWFTIGPCGRRASIWFSLLGSRECIADKVGFTTEAGRARKTRLPYRRFQGARQDRWLWRRQRAVRARCFERPRSGQLSVGMNLVQCRLYPGTRVTISVSGGRRPAVPCCFGRRPRKSSKVILPRHQAIFLIQFWFGGLSVLFRPRG